MKNFNFEKGIRRILFLLCVLVFIFGVGCLVTAALGALEVIALNSEAIRGYALFGFLAPIVFFAAVWGSFYLIRWIYKGFVES